MALRALVLMLAAVALEACGNPCTRIHAAQDAMNKKASGCSNQSQDTLIDLAKCEQGLSKCSPDDVKQLDAYAQCLNNVAACTPGQEVSFGLARLGCLQPVTALSNACRTATF